MSANLRVQTEPVKPPTRVKLDDGTSWPRPALEADDYYGVGHTLTYGTPTREDLLKAAAIIHAYGTLVMELTQARRNEVCTGIKNAIAAEQSA